ncbi:AAA family ATPase [Kineococcus sp. TBRC 1896]|uniref:AAA family ATPase n=1 Tax=Kineococcus mangrovi TaxID=1660183 RepID=A0ABV4I7T1_9ACTN
MNHKEEQSVNQLGWFGRNTAVASSSALGWFPVPAPRGVSRETDEHVASASAEVIDVPRETPDPAVASVEHSVVVPRETPSVADEAVTVDEPETDRIEQPLAPVVELRAPADETPAAFPDEEPDEEAVAPPVPRETSTPRTPERFPRPTETRIMTIANQKGGVGKTTTAVNLASALSAAGLKVLVLDLDPQGNASTALGIDHHSGVPGMYEVLVEGKPLEDVVQRCEEAPDLWCAPATVDLAGAEIELVSMVARESRLQRAVAKYFKGLKQAGERRVDYVLVDCPPSLGLLTINAFVAAPEVLIPIQCEYYALEGLSQLLSNIELIQEHLNPDLAVTTILLTMYDGRTRLAAQVVDEVRHHFGDQVLRSLVPRSVRISEAPSHGQTVMAYDPLSSGALAYLEAAREMAQRGVHEVEAPEGDADTGSAPAAADPWARWTDGLATRRGSASKEGGA